MLRTISRKKLKVRQTFMANLIKTTTRTMSVKHFSIHHNDREFLVKDNVWSLIDGKGNLTTLDPEKDKDLILYLEKKTKSVNLEKTKENKYFVFRGNSNGIKSQRPKRDDETFEDHRDAVYNYFFRKTLDAQNERKRKSGHAKRVKTMDEFIKSNPMQETILQVGNKSKSLKDKDIFEKICNEWVEENLLGKFNSEEGGILPINVAFHYDETTIHAHVDWIGVCRDKNGNWVMNKKQVLRNLGYDVPKELETDSNNPTKLFSDDIRKSFQDIVEKYTDFTVDRTPIKGSQNLKNGEYQEIMAEREKHANLIEEDKKLQEAIEAKAKAKAEASEIVLKATEEAEAIKARYDAFKGDIEALESELQRLKQSIDDAMPKRKYHDEEINEQFKEFRLQKVAEAEERAKVAELERRKAMLAEKVKQNEQKWSQQGSLSRDTTLNRQF